jgi:hypothetical protein
LYLRIGPLSSRPAQHCGALAQLVERFHGMEEVRGSIPLSSTKNPQVHARGFFAFSVSVVPGGLRGGRFWWAFLGWAVSASFGGNEGQAEHRRRGPHQLGPSSHRHCRLHPCWREGRGEADRLAGRAGSRAGDIVSDSHDDPNDAWQNSAYQAEMDAWEGTEFLHLSTPADQDEWRAIVDALIACPDLDCKALHHARKVGRPGP